MSLTTSRDRIAAAQDLTAKAGLDALLLTPGAELRYLTGFDAMPSERLTALVVPNAGLPTMIVPKLERPGAEEAGLSEAGVVIADHTDDQDAYRLALDTIGASLGRPGVRIGASERMWASQWHSLLAADAGLELHMASQVITGMRIVKSESEIAELARAAAAIDRVHMRMAEWLRPGRTEAQVAQDIAEAILEEGHSRVSFVIVGSGPNAASPHHEVSDRVLLDGDVVVVDIGGAVDTGYGSDCTRTYSLGDPPADFTAYYGALRMAHQAGVDAVRPGVTAAAVDAAARDVLERAGYGDEFTHRTGHGIGLDGHEEPYIVSGNDTLLVAGMAFSIEPGVYMSGRHGARIEDIVVCTDTGVRRLNTLPTDLITL